MRDKSQKVAAAVSQQQSTVVAGPGRDFSLDACAHEIMNRAGLFTLEHTNAATKASVGTPVSASIDQASNEIQVTDVAPGTSGWLVVEQFGPGQPPRATLFEGLAQAAALFGPKLAVQEAGVVTLRRDPSLGITAAHYVGTGNSRITALTLSRLDSLAS